MMSRIKIGQLGIGHNHGAAKMAALRNLSELFEIVGVAESDPVWREKRSGLSSYTGLPFLAEEEVLQYPGLDAVLVEKDVPELIPTAMQCAAQGLHIHLDKPGGESLADFRRLLGICDSRSLALQQAYVYRYNPALRFCLKAVQEGWLGDVFEIHAVMSRDDSENPDYRRWLAQFKGGAMYIFAGYLIDQVLLMLGKPDKVTPFMKQTRKDGLIDNGLAVLEYARATATIRVSVVEIDGMRHRRFIICGTDGSVELCPIEKSSYYTDPLLVRLTLKKAAGGYSSGTHQVDCGPLGCRYGAQLREFADIIHGKIANPYSLQHELLLHQTLLAACDYPEEA
ncbi:MAG TPA: Gfo/Idh/MocA family oxidoreductase [Lentisphaeria bacterium]|nr:Gfo/Idh/MocA family oxidoreductase [Lentisphaerota bacterium]HQC52482.1 Gfo/Idh/MocA family oxidoreductase [Lentisphaeria bacterium]